MRNSLRPLLLGLLLSFSGCANSPKWFDSPVYYKPSVITITEVDDIVQACANQYAVGCVRINPAFADVRVKKGLTEYAYKCVLSHEILAHVIKGLSHDNRLNYSLDCGPGVDL